MTVIDYMYFVFSTDRRKTVKFKSISLSMSEYPVFSITAMGVHIFSLPLIICLMHLQLYGSF
jgi:hypothetical protein